jgi:hypothetical protein
MISPVPYFSGLHILFPDFQILPEVSGKGRFLGSNIGINANPAYKNYWWGEGEVKMYLDGDTDLPTLVGTGTEDYIGTAWGQENSVEAIQAASWPMLTKTMGLFQVPHP